MPKLILNPITRDQAFSESEFHADGRCSRNIGPRGGVTTKSEVWRVSGRPKTWKREPERFEIPVKHGLYYHSRITNDNLNLWHTRADCPLNEDGAVAGLVLPKYRPYNRREVHVQEPWEKLSFEVMGASNDLDTIRGYEAKVDQAYHDGTISLDQRDKIRDTIDQKISRIYDDATREGGQFRQHGVTARELNAGRDDGFYDRMMSGDVDPWKNPSQQACVIAIGIAALAILKVMSHVR